MRTFKFGILAAVLMATGVARAAVPSEFTVQGVLRDGTGKLQTLPVNVSVTLYDSQSATTGMLAGPYVVNAVAVSNGLFTITIPEPTLAAKVAGAAAVWLEVSAGNDTFPRQKVSTNMFALQCASADDASKLGGVAAASYALKTDIAPDSAKLGGIVASGYLTTTVAASTYLPVAGTAADSSKLGGVAAAGYLTTAAAATTYQHVLLTPDCGVGKYIQSIATNGTVTCVNSPTGTVTSITAGTGLSGGAITGSGTIGLSTPVAVANGGTGLTSVAAGQFLRASGANTWAASGLQASDIPNLTSPWAIYYKGTPPNANTLTLGDPNVNFNPVSNGVSNGVIAFPGAFWRTGFIVYYPHQSTGNPLFQFAGATNSFNDFPVDVVSTGMITGSSDARLKTDIRPLTNALASLDELHGVSFRWESTGSESVGLIAQDVERAYPQLVIPDGRGFKAVAYGNLVAVVIEALKQSRAEESAELRAVRAENAALNTRLERLEGRLAQFDASTKERSSLALSH